MLINEKFHTQKIIVNYANYPSKKTISFRKICSDTPANYKINYIHSYPAKMLGQIPQTLLPIFCNKNDIVLDPFCGSGTVLFWSKLYGMNSLGIDINPLARLISRVKATPLNAKKLEKNYTNLSKRINKIQPQEITIPEFPNRDFWFEYNVQQDLSKIRLAIQEITNKKYKEFFLVCFSSIIRKVSNADEQIVPPVKSKKMRKLIEKGRRINTLEIFDNEVKQNISSMKAFYKDCQNNSKAKIIGKDARKIKLASNSVDFVITSPPYISAQKYFRSTQLELYWLGLINSNKLRKLDSQTIGTERVYLEDRNSINNLGFNLADYYIKKIKSKDVERAAIAHLYFKNMYTTFGEIYRVLRKGKKFALLIGNNRIKDIEIPSHLIIKEMCERLGFKTERIIREKIVSYGFMTKRNKTASVMPYERILIFSK